MNFFTYTILNHNIQLKMDQDDEKTYHIFPSQPVDPKFSDILGLTTHKKQKKIKLSKQQKKTLLVFLCRIVNSLSFVSVNLNADIHQQTGIISYYYTELKIQGQQPNSFKFYKTEIQLIHQSIVAEIGNDNNIHEYEFKIRQLFAFKLKKLFIKHHLIQSEKQPLANSLEIFIKAEENQHQNQEEKMEND